MGRGFSRCRPVGAGRGRGHAWTDGLAGGSVAGGDDGRRDRRRARPPGSQAPPPCRQDREPGDGAASPCRRGRRISPTVVPQRQPMRPGLRRWRAVASSSIISCKLSIAANRQNRSPPSLAASKACPSVGTGNRSRLCQQLSSEPQRRYPCSWRRSRSRMEHPEPNGCRRATPTSLPQHRAGHCPC